MKPLSVLSPARAELAVALVFLVMVAWQWHGPGLLAGTDAIAYIIGGVNVIAHGAYTNASGQPQVWFPPLYPVLIGIASLGGRLDPTTAAHVIAATNAILGLFLTARIARQAGARGYEPALAMAILGLNPIHQGAALYALSEATATLLALCAFTIWLGLADRSSIRRYVLLGVFVGLSYLTRPEGLLFLPLWAAVDLSISKAVRPPFGRYAVAAGVTALVALPYVHYLYQHTGRFTLTGKTDINLAISRAEYSGRPTQHINPATLEMELSQPDFTVHDEARRFLWNGARVLASYARNLGVILAVPVLLGLVSFHESRRRRFLHGGAVFVLYLALLLVFPVKNRYLHLSIPFLSILAARGLFHLLESPRAAVDPRRARLRLVSAVGIGIGLIVQSVAVARNNVDDRTGSALLRDAGVQLGRLAPSRGVVYELWGPVGFHAHMETRLLTPDDVPTILRYIAKHARPGQPVYLAVSTMESPFYHASVKALLQSADAFPQLVRRFTLSNDHGTVVVYEVQVRPAGSAPDR
jgi:4-amino-4-deoxy-L-arabinose transferase-like glycosyltransferase